jgi:hypothetical protein
VGTYTVAQLAGIPDTEQSLQLTACASASATLVNTGRPAAAGEVVAAVGVAPVAVAVAVAMEDGIAGDALADASAVAVGVAARVESAAGVTGGRTEGEEPGDGVGEDEHAAATKVKAKTSAIRGWRDLSAVAVIVRMLLAVDVEHGNERQISRHRGGRKPEISG